MGLIVVASSKPSAGSGESEAVARALSSAGRQGFEAPIRFDWVNGSAWWFDSVPNPGHGGAWCREGERFAACVGTMHWKGLSGKALLSALLGLGDDPALLPWRDISGAFAIVVGGPGGVWLASDSVGLQKVFHNPGQAVFSTSFVVCLDTSPRRPATVDTMRAAEYVMFGANHGVATPFDDVCLARPTHVHDLRTGRSVELHTPASWSIACPYRTATEAIEDISARIEDDFSSMRRAFGTRIGMALSGGFDSRLILAALHRSGVQPELFVYGRAQDSDVAVATRVADALGMAIEPVDKSVLDRELPALSAASLGTNLDFFDGMPNDGIFDRGSDRMTRLRQLEGGKLNLNGGGGEILRNFFYLKDRPYSAAELVGAFYTSGVDRAVPDARLRNELSEMLQDEVLGCLGRPAGSRAARGTRLPRQEIELVYALLRLRYWMGRNNSLAVRCGSFMTPLAHPRLVALSAAVPLDWKTFGQMEASIIHRLSPAVAKLPSSYGFSFSEAPSPKHRLSILATMHRPLYLRRHAAGIKGMLRKPSPLAVPKEWAESILATAETFGVNQDGLVRLDQVNRLMTLKALFHCR